MKKKTHPRPTLREFEKLIAFAKMRQSMTSIKDEWRFLQAVLECERDLLLAERSLKAKKRAKKALKEIKEKRGIPI